MIIGRPWCLLSRGRPCLELLRRASDRCENQSGVSVWGGLSHEEHNGLGFYCLMHTNTSVVTDSCLGTSHSTPPICSCSVGTWETDKETLDLVLRSCVCVCDPHWCILGLLKGIELWIPVEVQV